jgi:hypothetical protein
MMAQAKPQTGREHEMGTLTGPLLTLRSPNKRIRLDARVKVKGAQWRIGIPNIRQRPSPGAPREAGHASQ